MTLRVVLSENALGDLMNGRAVTGTHSYTSSSPNGPDAVEVVLDGRITCERMIEMAAAARANDLRRKDHEAWDRGRR